MATREIRVSSTSSLLSLSASSVYSSGSSMSIGSADSASAPAAPAPAPAAAAPAPAPAATPVPVSLSSSATTAASSEDSPPASTASAVEDAPRGPDGFRPGDAVKLEHSVRCEGGSVGAPNHQYSYALYYGNGRVIHSWSSSRTKFRVRVDTLRSLQLAGVKASDATEDMDAFCASVFDYKPQGSWKDMVARAREALHCETRGRRSSITLILHARYGDAAKVMITSLMLIVPSVVKLVDIQATSGLELSLTTMFGVLMYLMDDKRFPMPKILFERSAVAQQAPRSDNELRALAATRVSSIKALLGSEPEPFLAAWIMIVMTRTPKITVGSLPGPSRVPSPAVPIVTLTDMRLASMIFNPITQNFAVVITSYHGVFERLVSTRLQCGVCLENVLYKEAKLLECAHMICGECLEKWQKACAGKHCSCPFCRLPIAYVRVISCCLKTSATERIRQNDCEGLAANDVDAPEFAVAQAPTSAAAAGADASEEAAPPTALLAEGPTLAPDELVAVMNEKRELTVMEIHDEDAPDAA